MSHLHSGSPITPIAPPSRSRRSARIVAVTVVAALVAAVAACGSDSGSGSGSGAVSGVDGVQGATLQINVEGTIRDPEQGLSTVAGSGSGFFISPDGLAVTNNHVVTGAGRISVTAGGGDTEYAASVLGVSECNDLALIQVDVEGEVPFLEWFDGEIRPGLDVYAAGFPLGDPEFTLTRGVVSKAEANDPILSTLASVDRALEHDANIQQGNSGGPLVSNEGTVVGVNYAGTGDFYGTTEQFFSIAADAARPVVDQLRNGDDESLGVNATPFIDETSGVSGLWVAGVAPGSAASRANLKPGDILVTMNGIELGVDPANPEEGLADAFFAAYCDAIRSAGDRPIEIEVVRFDTREVLTGEINGDRPLESSGAISSAVEERTEVPEGEEYTEYVTLTDATNTLQVDVPAAWSDVDLGPAADDGLPFIAAAEDITGFNERFDVPGMAFFALPAGTPSATIISDLSAPVAAECTDAGTEPYDDGVFVGEFKVWENCAGTNTSYIIVVTNAPAAPQYTFATVVQAVTAADLGALERVIASFNLV